MSMIVPDDAMLQHEIEQLAVKAGKMILAADVSDQRSDAHAKKPGSSEVSVAQKSSRRDLVTSKDLEIQKMLMKRLSIFVDNCRFLCEEDLTGSDLSLDELHGAKLITDPAQVNEGTCFIIDPIDGTANFVHGCRHSCTSIAMTVRGETRLGVIYDPYHNELFSACKGRGAWLNGRRLPVFDAALADSITVFGTAPYDDTTNAPTFRLAHLLYELSSDVRRTGSAALDCCWTACGRFGLYAELGLSPWDFAAGKLIAEETGCVVTDIHGLPLNFTGRLSILCGRPTAVKEFLEHYHDDGPSE